MHSIISPTVQMGKLRYREAKNFPKVTRPTSVRAWIQTNARVFTLHLWILERAWHFAGQLPDSASLLRKRPVKDATQSLRLNFSHSTRRGRRAEAQESTQALTSAGPQAQRGMSRLLLQGEGRSNND